MNCLFFVYVACIYVYEMICVDMYVAYICVHVVVPAMEPRQHSVARENSRNVLLVGNFYESQCFGETKIFRFVKFLALIYVLFIGEVMPIFFVKSRLYTNLFFSQFIGS